MAATSLTSFTPVTSLPPNLDEQNAVQIGCGNAVVVVGTLTAGAGTARLLRFLPQGNGGKGQWYRASDPLGVDFSKEGGQFYGCFLLDAEGTAYYQLLLPSGSVVQEAFMQGIYR